MNTGSLVWFKNDLRLHDNEVLVKAVNRGAPILFLYCLDPNLFKNTFLSFKKTGLNRYFFIKQTLEDLERSLKDLDVKLIITYNSAEIVIPKLIGKYNIDIIYTEQEYAHEELIVLEKLQKKVAPAVVIEQIWGKTLYHIDDIPFKIEDIPLTSKAYRIPTGKNVTVRQPLAIPEKLLPMDHTEHSYFPSLQELGFTASDTIEKQPFMHGGESKALEQLQHYTFDTELLTSYRWTRNRSLGYEYSTKFSPYLAVGSLSPRTIYNQVKKYEQEVKKNQSTWWVIFELVWRDYFTFKGMKMGNAIFKTEGYRNKKLEFTNHKELFEKWCTGNTGVPFVDAHMRQLNQTGYMSNRGRVNCSSFLVHDYKIDWTWGAAYFENRLIDYDVSSNWMNWHVQAYEIWYTNPIHQSLKYKAKTYIQKWIPELTHIESNYIYIPWLLQPKPNYPSPVAIYKKWDRSINKILKTVASEEV